MPYLLAVSLIWAFSPGLTKGLTAGLDPSFVAAARLGLALLVFLPFLRLRGLTGPLALRLAGIGAIQFGVMYLAYNASFRLLQSHEVALFTLTTPVLVTLLADLFARQFRVRALAAALLAVGGTVVLVFTGRELRPTVTGLLLVQLSNLAFAFGQIAYKRLREQHPALRDREIFALPYAGAFLLALAAALTQPLPATLTTKHVVTLLYLGGVASGLGFFLWNIGATKVGTGALAVMNNAKIPLMVACSLVFFGEYADVPRLFLSLVLLTTAVWFAEKR
jgi:drug/metabolite transporter (DMT)-like permease